jgi:protein-S-isoprenylcysteine O-methyltransferase Ste14
LGEASACRGGLEHANNFPLTFSTVALNHRHGSHRLEKRKGHSECRRTHRRTSPAGRFAEARMKHKIISIPPVYFLTCIIITLLLHVLVSSLNWIGFPFTLVGVAFLGADTYWLARAHRLLTQHATPVTFAPSTCIIQGGLYQYSQNPMYVGFVVFLIGCSVLSGNILSVLSPLCFFVVLDRMFIPYEEEKMESTFGKEYLEYRRKVRRWL